MMLGDGHNLWEMIKNDSKKNNRNGFVYNIDNSSAAIRYGSSSCNREEILEFIVVYCYRDGHYKLIVGNPGRVRGWVPPGQSSAPSPSNEKNKTIWLFNVMSMSFSL